MPDEAYPKRLVVEVWQCSKGHRHDAYESANLCEQRERRQRASGAAGTSKCQEPASLRALRQEGKTFREIGAIVGRADDPSVPVSVSIATNLVERWELILRRRASVAETRSKARIEP